MFNPKESVAMNILAINDLALELVARDFSNGHSATNAGPTKTSRALAIIHLAAHDAYAGVTGKFAPLLANLPAPQDGTDSDEAAGTGALIVAGAYAAGQLYPDDAEFINSNTATAIAALDPRLVSYGEDVAEAWLNARKNDGSSLPQLDTLYSSAPGRHRPDPQSPGQKTLGRTWGNVKPFVLSNVQADAFLAPPPDLTSTGYASAFDQVFDLGRNDLPQRKPDLAAIGVFWGYDGSNLLGTPPRLYNQIVRKIPEFQALFHPDQVRILTAINVAMADAGIAAWHWKYEYDFWRPVVGIREANKGFGPSGLGDQNTHRKNQGDPFWLPLGAPRSNPLPSSPMATFVPVSNFTPNFPAYPSGHATFGSACFETVACLLKKTPETVCVSFTSDEFNGTTRDNTGVTRPQWQQTFTLREAIEQNKLSRIYLGVHWCFDATGGEIVGKAVADKVIAAFQ
jgi:membrane-associated phospholipid phosphatase